MATIIEIIQGEQQPFTIDLVSKATGKPFDLTGYDEITVCFKSESTIVTKDTSSGVSVLGDEKLGQITGTLETTDTTTMPATSHGHIEVAVDFGGGDIKKAQLLNKFIVIESICS